MASIVEEAATDCANCGAPLVGPYCHRCGQGAADHLGSLRAFAAHVAEVVLQYDSRALRTVRDLLFRPGRVAADYLSGHRVRYMPPLQTFGVAVTVLFLTGAFRPFVTFNPRTHWFRSSLAGTVGFSNPLSAAELAALARRGVSLELFGERFTSAATAQLSTYLVLTVPVFALAVAVLCLRRRPLTHHVVFALYWSAFYLTTMTVFQLVPRDFALRGPVFFSVLAWTLSYLVIALRRVYGVGWIGATLRGVLLMTAYLAILIAWMEVVVDHVRRHV